MAPPIEIFHPIFAQFRAKLADTEIDVPEEVVRDTASLMRSCSAIEVSEQPREKQSLTFLSKILKGPFLQAVDLDRTSGYAIALCTETTVCESAAVAIIEENSELGDVGSEPSVQGSFSYIKFWVDETVGFSLHYLTPSSLYFLTASRNSRGLLLSLLHSRTGRTVADNIRSCVHEPDHSSTSYGLRMAWK